MANRNRKIRAAATKRALRARLPQPLSESEIADEIQRYLFKHFETVPGKAKLAKDLALHLSSQFLLTSKKALGWWHCIIEFYPEEQCMLALLGDKKRPWLSDCKIRNTVLRGIIGRAREKSDELASALQEKFQAFLI
jgi:hypothetical protein